MRSKPNPRGRGERGMVLVAALMVLAMLSILAVAGVSTSTLEVKIAGHDRDAKQAFYLAEAGLIRAQYEVLKGWGKGTGGAGTFAFAAPLPALPASLAWAANKWTNFQLQDERGVDCTVATNTVAGGVTCAGAAAVASGSAHFYYRSSTTTVAGDAVGSVVTVTPSPGWVPDEWDGCWVEIGGTTYDVTDNTADTLTLSPAPAAGPVIASLTRGRPELKQLCRPNITWTNTNFDGGVWYLVSDAAPTQFHKIASATGGPRFALTIATTPAAGNFSLVTNPWLIANRGPGKNPFADPLVAPSNIPYVTPLIDVTESVATPEAFALTARSATQTITMNARILPGGAVSFSNWRQGP